MPESSADFDNTQSLIEAIQKGPEKPIRDPQYLLEKIVRPWVTRASKEDRFRTALSSTDPFVQALIAKYKLPEKNLYPFADHSILKPSDADTTWSLVSHGVYSLKGDQLSDVHRIGGILGTGEGNATFWNVDVVERNLERLDMDPYLKNQTHFVFVAPTSLVYSDEPHLPLTVFKLGIKASDLPKFYYESSIPNMGNDDRPEAILRATKVLPLDWCIAILKPSGQKSET